MKILRVLFLLSLITVCAFAATDKKKVSPDEVKLGKGDKHVDMVTWFEADAAWPQRPAGYKYGPVTGVVVDKDDNVWIATAAEKPIQLFSSDGKFIRSFGGGIVNKPHFIRLDNDGNIWVANPVHHVIYKFTPKGGILRTIGILDEAGVDEKHFDKPTDMAFAENGDIFVSDGYGNSRIVHLDSKGKFINAWGKFGQGPGEFDIAHSIAMDSTGRIYVADRNNARVQVFEQSGKFVAQWRNILVPWGICITENDEIWVCGSSPMIWSQDTGSLGTPPKDHVLMRFDRDGKVHQIWALPKHFNPKGDMPEGWDVPSEKPAEQSGEVNWVHGIGVDSKGNVYIGDIAGKNVQKFVPHTDPKAPKP